MFLFIVENKEDLLDEKIDIKEEDDISFKEGKLLILQY